MVVWKEPCWDPVLKARQFQPPVGKLVPEQPGHRSVYTRVLEPEVGGQQHEHPRDACFRGPGEQIEPSVRVGSALPKALTAANGVRIPGGKAQPAQEEQGVGGGRPLRQVKALRPRACLILGSQQPGAPPLRCHTTPFSSHLFRGRAHKVLKYLPSNGRIALKQPPDDILSRGTGRRRFRPGQGV